MKLYETSNFRTCIWYVIYLTLFPFLPWLVSCLIQENHIYTSGASGTNAAVIRGALRAEKPELLTVILPQSLSKQPSESQELLAKVSFFFLFVFNQFSVSFPQVSNFHYIQFWSLQSVFNSYSKTWVKTVVSAGSCV